VIFGYSIHDSMNYSLELAAFTDILKEDQLPNR